MGVCVTRCTMGVCGQVHDGSDDGAETSPIGHVLLSVVGSRQQDGAAVVPLGVLLASLRLELVGCRAPVQLLQEVLRLVVAGVRRLLRGMRGPTIILLPGSRHTNKLLVLFEKRKMAYL